MIFSLCFDGRDCSQVDFRFQKRGSKKWAVVISIIKTRLISGWRYRQAPPGCKFRSSICRFLRLGGRVLLFMRRVIRREGSKEKVLLIGGKVKTFLVEGIVVSHGGEVVKIRTVV